MREEETRAYLASIAIPKELIDRHVAVNAQGLSSHDGELGWVPTDHSALDGVDGSRTFYTYAKDRGRTVVNFPDRPSRIHTYGDSFTHCDQVSDGETWQEYLAAHLQEPIRNFGIGGHSVYQAYRRMQIVEPVDSADYVLLNIWSDDHWRNLDSWRAIRMAKPRFTLPYLRVDAGSGRCEEHDNLCPSGDDVYRLGDADWLWETFGDDPVLRATMVTKVLDDPTDEDAAWVAEGFGFGDGVFADLDPVRRAERVHREAALLASRYVVEQAEAYAAKHGKQFLLLLSFGNRHVQEALDAQPLFDRTFLEWLSGRATRVIDLRDAFKADFARYRVSSEAYLAPFYNGHHTPRGNHFFAWAIKDEIVGWLDPKPRAYG